MKRLNSFRPLILAIVAIFAILLACGVWTLPESAPDGADGFSAERVAEDIKVISKEYHSVAQPEAKDSVRTYLAERLSELNADKVETYDSDTLVGPEGKHVSYEFVARNVLAEFAPSDPEIEDPTYMMLIAHYDSRYSQPMPQNDTVWSYGAIDDGYGLGVILETVNQLNKNRDQWKQGVKVLFTDAEEVGMMGMKDMYSNHHEVFENVGFVINVEARGPFGPVLLFETSPGNEKLMELYEYAEYPYSYSLTNVVYEAMPNFTDFNVVRKDIPGMNFSTVADINHYHNDKDCYENIDLDAIQHYGCQILPIAKEYLTNEKYADADYLKAEDDMVFFTVPVLGLFSFGKIGYIVLNVVFFILFLCVFALEGVRGRMSPMKIFKSSVKLLGTSIAVMLAGVLLTYLCTLISGAEFKLLGIVQGVSYDNVFMLVTIILMVAVMGYLYWRKRDAAKRRASLSMRSSATTTAICHHAQNALYGIMTLLFFLSLVTLISLGENMMFFIPFASASLALLLSYIKRLRVWYVVSIFLILLHAVSFLYTLSMALTIGGFGLVAMLAFLDAALLIPMVDLYLLPSKK